MGGQSAGASMSLKSMPTCADIVLALVPDGTNEQPGNEDVQAKLQSAAVWAQSPNRFELPSKNLEKLKRSEGTPLNFPAMSLATQLKL
jgi:hypothetical protein